jgi:hypothetical protein
MIMLRHNIPLIPAEFMGAKMGLVVPREDKFLFWDNNVKTGKKPKAGYGTQLSIGEGLFLNDVLKKLNIPLKMTRKLIDKFESLEKFKTYLEKINFDKSDALVCFDSGELNGKTPGQGHVCVLDTINIDKNEVRIIDPSAIAPKWRVVKMEKLFQSMKVHGKDNGAGFWEFSVVN